jgi:hypothetical protein
LLAEPHAIDFPFAGPPRSLPEGGILICRRLLGIIGV